MAYPKTYYFPDSDNHAIVERLIDGSFAASDLDRNDLYAVVGRGDTELSAIADLARQLREAE
jgi:hypothetical protein